MPYFHFIWTDEIADHIAEHGISREDFEYVVCNSVERALSRSAGLPVAWGHTRSGRYIMAVYDPVDSLSVLPVTAYEIPEPQ